ncbi:MAG: cysteine peptidase family C39 domain-containing protein [Methanobacterium sp.]|jgi:predicted double-glycine peptidase
MKNVVAVLLAVLIIGTTPAVASEYGEITADAMATKGKGADVTAASELVEAVESGETTGIDNETLTANVSGTNTTMSDDPAPAEATGVDTQTYDPTESVDVQFLDLNDSLDNYTVNVTVPQIDTSGIVMQSTDYSCGPAALATVLQNIGINTTEGELKVLAGTDESGTSMYGLVRAVHAKGLSAVGMRLSVDDLKPNMIVHVIKDGEGHYSVVRDVTSESIYLADPSKGNIVLSRKEFSAIFTGNVLVISDPNMQVNQTAEQANNTNTSTVQAENQTLASEEMESIKGQSTVANPETSQILTSEIMESIRGKKLKLKRMITYITYWTYEKWYWVSVEPHRKFSRKHRRVIWYTGYWIYRWVEHRIYLSENFRVY